MCSRRGMQHRKRHSFFSVDCTGKLFHAVAIVRPGTGTPSSRSKVFGKLGGWSGLARMRHVWTRITQPRQPAEQIGSCERHGGILHKNLSMVVPACRFTGKAAMKMAAATCVLAKTDFFKGAFRPSFGLVGSGFWGAGALAFLGVRVLGTFS